MCAPTSARNLLIGLVILFAGVTTASACETSESDDLGTGFANPSAVYCIEMGYQYKVINGPSGQRGVCVFPDGSECDAWAFLEGKCGQEYSYCARLGCDIETRADGNNPFSRDYAVCVSEEGDLVGPVTELMRLSEICEKGRVHMPPLKRKGAGGSLSLGLQPPSSFDWRNHEGYNWITSIKDQGSCGSCWAFSAVAAVEALYNIRYDDPSLDLDLSEEYLVSDCYPGPSCCGGWHSSALAFIGVYGIPDEACMPYVDRVGCSCWPDTCKDECFYKGDGVCSDATCSDKCPDWVSRLTRIDASDYVPNDPEAIKEHIIGKGPLSVAMGTGSTCGAYWDGDIYRCTNDDCITHCVVIVGYDDAGGYWIAKNSHGTEFGENGYFKVGYGECNIENNVLYLDKVDCGCHIASNTILYHDLLDCPEGLTVGSDGITLDGNGRLIDGEDTGYGIYLNDKHNVTIKNCEVREFEAGIYLLASSNDSLIDNTVNNNQDGIRLSNSSNNAVAGNYLAENAEHGVCLKDSSNHNTLWNNEFVTDAVTAYEEAEASSNSWNLAETGNYWSDCQGNPGYPDFYEIPGPGDGVDYYPTCPGLRGDANGDGIVNVADVVYLVNYLYRGGDPPTPEEAGDANCDGIVNVADVVYLVNYLYRGGDPPGCP